MDLKTAAHPHEKGEKTSPIKIIPKKFWNLINWIAKGQQKTGLHCKA
jgi:hypothetical protein